MGKINYVYNPENWIINNTLESKILEGDIVYDVTIGEGEDYYSYEIKEYISKDVYDNLINGIYTLKKFPYSDKAIILTDENNNLVPLVNGLNIDYNDLDKYQKLYLDDLNFYKKLIRKK